MEESAEEDVLCDSPFRDPNLRHVIEKILHLKCIVPSFICGHTGNTARCLLEETPASSSPESTLSESFEDPTGTGTTSSTLIAEDILCKVMSKRCRSGSGCNDSIHCDNEADFSSRCLMRVKKELLNKLWSLFISPLPHIHLPSLGASSLPLYLRPCVFSNSRHPGIASLYSLIESERELIVTQKYLKFSVLTLSRLSTCMSCASLAREAGEGAKDMRLRFVVYQLLQVVAFIHSRGLCVDLSRPQEVTLSDNIWVTLGVTGSNRMNLAAECAAHLREHQSSASPPTSAQNANGLHHNNAEKEISLDAARVHTLIGAHGLPPVSTESIERPPSYYEPITLQWVTGKVSNLEYLLAINTAAGRSAMDPSHHPVLPWVTDFTAEVVPGKRGGMMLRDLTKSKFRLSKGDRQLATTFEHSSPPHHIPEILSELTYYIYMARRTPMHMLKRIVRGYFDADHYPHSMTRMFNWTPDECCPEFYTDVTVFESIHRAHGLEDIELPDFAPTPEEFLVYHRAVLESDEVSSQLHHWIDLTFGHKLIGEEALRNLNVPLVHALSRNQEQGASPDLEGHPGIVVLFESPHPKKYVTAVSESDDVRDTGHVPHDHGDKDIKAMLEMGETYGIVTTPYPDLSNDAVAASMPGVLQYLSEGNKEDNTLMLLKFAKSGMVDANSSGADSTWCRAEALKFASMYGTILEPFYEMPLFPAYGLGATTDKPENLGNKGSWDKEFLAEAQEQHEQQRLGAEDARFVHEINKLRSCVSSRDQRVSMSAKAVIQLLQAQDLFALGCLVAEIMTGKPLLSREDASAQPSFSDMQALLQKCSLRCQSPTPLNIRRLIALLTHPNPVHRPSAADILKCCCVVAESAVVETVSDVEHGLFQFEVCPKELLFQPLSSSSRRHILEDFCYFAFPSHFQSVYIFIGRIKIARDGVSKLRAVADNLLELSVFRLKGVSLLLPHVLEVIGDPTPFQQLITGASSSTHEVQKLITEYAKVINVLGDRLGSQNTASILIPHVMNLFATLNSPTLLIHFIKSKHLWLVLIARAGPKCFLRHFLPLLLTYLMCGSLQALPRATDLFCREAMLSSFSLSSSAVGQIPLWVTGASFSEDKQSGEWLHSCSKQDLLLVQEEALKVIMMLSAPEALGPGLCSRYVLPALISLVANPRFSVVGFGFGLADDEYCMSYQAVMDTKTNVSRNVLNDRESFHNLFSNKITLMSEYDEDYMFLVRAVLGTCHMGGEAVITTVILPKIFYDVLPKVFANILDVYTPDAGKSGSQTFVSAENFASSPYFSSLLEIIALLRGMLSMLPANVIRSYYFNSTENAYANGSVGGDIDGGMSLLTLLVIMPLPFINPEVECVGEGEMGDSNPSQDHARMLRLLEFRQRHSTFVELCRLITAAASQVSSDVVHNTILPAINKFFTKFVHTYCDLDVRSDLMALAFEIGRSLYIPLVHLVGAYSFSTAVPDVNPRLEVWLLHCCSASDYQTRISELNVLPDTIFPVTMSKQDFLPEAEPEKERGIWHGLGPFMTEWLAPSPPRKPKFERKASMNKETEARLNQQMDDAMRDAIAQQEVKRGLVETPVRRRRRSSVQDSDDDSVDAESPSPRNDNFLRHSTDHDVHLGGGDVSQSVLLDSKGSKVTRNPQTLSIMHYHGDNSFYHSLHSFDSHLDPPGPADRVYFKKSQSHVQLALVNSAGKLISKPQVATSFRPRSISMMPNSANKNSTDNVIMGNFKKAFKVPFQRTPSGPKPEEALSYYNDFNDEEDVPQALSDAAWLFGGSGRWVPDTTATDADDAPPMPPKSKSGINSPGSSCPLPNISRAITSPLKKKPAACVSMASPKVSTDVATEAGEMFALNMINKTTWAFDALAYKANAAGAINILLTDPTERFLVAGTKDGEMKVWGLTSNPVVELMKYSAHQAGVYAAGFLKSGTHVASCDGTIRIWDIQTGMTIGDLQRSHSELDVFSHLQVVSPRLGVGSDMSKHGDDQLMTCAGPVLAHYDIRVGYMCSLNPISEWKLYTNFSNSSPNEFVNAVSLTCSACNEDYVCIGSTNGTLWTYERRTGRPIHCWLGHEGSPVLKIHFLDRHHIVSVTERNAFCWNLQEDEPKKVYQVKGLPDCSAVMNTNSIFMQSFEDPHAGYQDATGSGSQKNINLLFCLAGHKISAGEVTSKGLKDKRSGGGKESFDPDVRLTKSYVNDSNHLKMTKQRLQISSACMLPLRRLLLLGTPDGLIRVVT